MSTANELVNWAKAQLGQTDGSKYAKIAVGWASPYDWCAYFVSAGLIQTATKCPYFPSGFAFDKRDFAKIGDRWREPADLYPGYPIAFDWDGGGQKGGDHVGIVATRVSAGDYWVYEGNCGGRVQLKHRTIANTRSYNEDGSVRGIGIIGGIAPYFDEERSSSTLGADGIFGTKTCKWLQTALQKRGFYKGYLIDGEWGYYSKLALQQYLRKLGYYTSYWLLDGWFGTASVKALQTYLRALGYYTSDYLIDGDWGKYTTMALQRALNDGKF